MAIIEKTRSGVRTFFEKIGQVGLITVGLVSLFFAPHPKSSDVAQSGEHLFGAGVAHADAPSGDSASSASGDAGCGTGGCGAGSSDSGGGSDSGCGCGGCY